MTLDIPLMKNNITREDRNALIDFLNGDPILTQSTKVREFEAAWSRWLGVKHSIFVNSGSSANVLTMAALKHLFGNGEIIVPTLTWSSDIAAVLHAGMRPVFVDIDLQTLGMDLSQVIAKITPNTRAVFLTHVLGFNALRENLLVELKGRGIQLIEDVCESHGATFKDRKLGTYGFASNFSFYYAHHMSTVEGGMVCTDDDTFYETIRMLRSHGMVREVDALDTRRSLCERNPELNPDFIFAYPGYNMRGTELNAVIGLNQLKRLDQNNEIRRRNLNTFLRHLDSARFWTDFEVQGSVNYAFPLILREPNADLSHAIAEALAEAKVECRRGLSGGGNQLRQPFVRGSIARDEHLRYPKVEHVHFHGYYIGNYPGLESEKIVALCRLVNEARVGHRRRGAA